LTVQRDRVAALAGLLLHDRQHGLVGQGLAPRERPPRHRVDRGVLDRRPQQAQRAFPVLVA